MTVQQNSMFSHFDIAKLNLCNSLTKSPISLSYYFGTIMSGSTFCAYESNLSRDFV